MHSFKSGRLAALFLSSLGLIAAAACGSSSTAPATNPVVGAYTLQTVDGASLPAPAKDGTGAVAGKYTSATVTLAADGSFAANTNYTLTNGTTGTSPATGTYTVSGSTVSFTSAGKTSTAVFSGGNTLTIVQNTQTMVYTK